MTSPDGPCGLRLTHTGLLRVGDVAQLHDTGLRPSKAAGDELPSPHEGMDNVTMHPLGVYSRRRIPRPSRAQLAA